MLRYCFFLSLLIFCLPSLIAQDDDLPLTELDDLFQEFDRPDAPGLTVAIRYRGKTVYERAYGLADLATGRKNTTDTPMAAGEFSGQMTAFALLLLEEDGKLQLSDPLVQYLPELGEAVADVTLGHLLSRTHGLIDQIFAQVVQGRNRQVTTSADLLRLYARQPGPGHSP
ncbi:MAG: serine hydrolase domain-containing protein, partial [Bacteroidota bacterium]